MGAFFLVLVAGLSGDALTIGIALAIIVYATGPITGGHINPAVTLALWINNKIKANDAIWYMISQTVGAILAALLFRYITDSTMTLSPNSDMWFKVGLAEALFTFMLASVVLLTAVYKKAEGNQYFGAAIGLTVFVGIMSVGAFTGGVFNPAVAIGPIVVDALNAGTTYMHLPLYLISIFVGGGVAGLAFKQLGTVK